MSAFDPRITPARPDLAAAELEGRVSSERFAEGVAKVVIAPNAPLLSRPDQEVGLASELLVGEKFNVFEERDGWAWGQAVLDDYVGFVPAKALGSVELEPTHRIAARQSHVYPTADIKTRPVAWLPMGGLVTGEVEGDFLQTEMGFIPKSHVIWAESIEEDPVEVAEAFLGAPYLWGGRTALGIDCSGLTQMALVSTGWICPRDSDMQEEGFDASLPPEKPLARGDLVFWKGHVGLMRDEETLIHANAHHMAVVAEPLTTARKRIEAKGGGRVTSIHRLPD